MVDALDTLLLMGLTKEYDYARTHVKALDFTLLTGGASAYGSADGVTIPTFETCIRYLGGLLGAYDVSGGDEVMLERAKDLGDWMMGAFGTHSGLPQGRYRLGQNPKGDKGGRMVLSEAGSMTLEYTRLSLATGDPSYYSVVRLSRCHLLQGVRTCSHRFSARWTSSTRSSTMRQIDLASCCLNTSRQRYPARFPASTAFQRCATRTTSI